MSARLFSRALGAAQLLAIVLAAPTLAGWYDTGVPVSMGPGIRGLNGVATDDAGGILFVWNDYDRATSSNTVFVQRLTVDGEVPSGWTVGGVPVAVATVSDHQAIVADGLGGAFVAWAKVHLDPGPPQWERRYVHVTHLLADGSRDPAWPEDGVVCRATALQVGPQLALDGAGGVYVVWGDAPEMTEDTEVFVQHLRADGTIWPGWPAQGLGVASPDLPGPRTDPRIQSDGAGGLFVAFDDLRGGTTAEDWRVYLTRFTADGALSPGWMVNGNLVSTDLGPGVQPRVAPDGAGGVLVIWQDERNHEPSQVYGLRFLADGSKAPGWPQHGLRVGTTSCQQFDHTITPDGDGGAFVAWTDIVAPYEIRVQRVTAEGQLSSGWPESGQLVATQRARQMRPDLAADGEGGVFVTWVRAEVGNDPSTTVIRPGFFVQHLGEDGSRMPGWDAGGRMFASDDSVNAAYIVPSGNSAAILAWVSLVSWEDDRQARFFAVRLHDVIPSPDPIPNPRRQALALERATPNPARRQFTVDFALPDASPATLELFDVTGRRVASQSVGAMGAGQHAVDFRMREHPPGMYVLVLRRAGSVLTRRVAIVE